MSFRIRVLILSGLVLCTSPASSQPNGPVVDLASMTHDVKILAPGLTYTRYTGQNSGERVVWSISAGVSRSAEERKQIGRCAEGLGLASFAVEFRFPGARSKKYQERLFGQFDSHAVAQSHLATLKTIRGCSFQIKASPQYPLDQTLPWRIHVLKLQSSFAGRLEAVRGSGGAAGRTKPSALASHYNAYAAVNGGFFVMEPTEGVVGESTGISIISGSLVSEPDRRPWAMIRNGDKVRVHVMSRDDAFRPAIIFSDKTQLTLDGINRDPRMLRNCGALNGRVSTVPWHDRTCEMEDQIVAISAQAGFLPTPQSKDIVGKIGIDGAIKELHQVEPLQSGEYLIIATGARRTELQEKLRKHSSAAIHLTQIPLDRASFAVNGGPTLARDGKVVRDEDEEGWPFRLADSTQATQMHGFVSLRAPRTALGIAANGDILLVVIDGHRFRDDLAAPVPMNGGATLDELRSIMQVLGARDAINLDGGGSSVMIGPDGVLSHPSDASGERPVGETLVIVPNVAR